MRLANKVVLVAGGAGEVGEGIARALLAAGAIVAVASRSNRRLSEFHDRIPIDWDGRYVPIVGDVGTPRGVIAVRDRVDIVCRRLDVVVASIGAWWRKGPLIFSEVADWEAVLASNLTPHYLLARTMMPVINKRPGSSYVFIAGAVADVPVPNSGLVSIATHANLMMARVLASEHRHEPVRVNAVVIGTPVRSRLRPDGEDHWLTSDDVGRYVAWLISDASTLRGETVRFDTRAQVDAAIAATDGAG